MTVAAVRSTSLLIYEEIMASGLLTFQKALVYRQVFLHGPLTGREVTKMLAEPGETATSYHKRLSELRDLGVIKESPARICAVSGNLALTWEVTGALPVKRGRRPPSANAKFRAAALELCRDMIALTPPLFASRMRARLAELEAMP